MSAVLLLLGACRGGEGRAFDGVDDHVVVADPGGLDGDALSIEAWVWPAAGGVDKQDLVARRSPAGGQDTFTFRLRQDWGGVLELGLARDGREWGTAGRIPVPREQWTFVAVTHDRRSGRVCFYVGGVADACATSPILPGSAADSALWLGGDPLHGPAARPFNGRLRDVQLWASVRSPVEVSADATAKVTTGAPALRWTGP